MCADAFGKIGSVVGSLGSGVDVSAALQLGEWHTAVEYTALIEQLVALTINEDAPVPGHTLRGGMLRADARGAVGGDGVIPARFVPQDVERTDVFEEAFARGHRRNGGAVKIDVLALAVVRSHADHVALVGHDVDEFELPVKPADGRVGLAKLLARLDGETNGRRIGELEANDGMRDPGRAPVIDGEVDAGDLRNAHGARLPMRRVVGFGPVVAVADVVQGHFIALDVGPRFLGHICLPIAILCGLDGQPPHEHAGEEHGEAAQFSPEWPNKEEHDHKRDREHCSRDLVAGSKRPVEPDGAERPGRSDDADDGEEQTTNPEAQALHPSAAGQGRCA